MKICCTFVIGYQSNIPLYVAEQELNSYRFTSGKEPTDEMLSQIMSEVRAEAMERRRESDMRYRAEMEKQRAALKAHWEERLRPYING